MASKLSNKTSWYVMTIFQKTKNWQNCYQKSEKNTE